MPKNAFPASDVCCRYFKTLIIHVVSCFDLTDSKCWRYTVVYNISRHQFAAFLNQCTTSLQPSVTNHRRKNNDGHKHKVTTGLSGNDRSPLAGKVNDSWNQLLCRADVDTCKGSDLNENSNTSINGGEKPGFPRLSVLLQPVCSLPRCKSSCHGNKLCRDGFRFWQWL